MTKQTKSLGGLADIQASPPPAPETTDERIDRLERRLTQAEVLLNDVMQQLDKPYRDQQLGNGKPKQAKPQQAKPVKPKQVNPAKPQQTKPKRVNPPPLPPATEPETPDEKQAKEAAKRLAAKQAKQARKEKHDALVIAQQAESAKITADACDKLLSVLDNGDRITTKELIDMGISFSQQIRLRESDAYKASGIQCEKLPDESHEYSIETTD
jgi:hypothetical protein